MNDDLLGITARGKYRFKIIDTSIKTNNLITANVEK
jgi:Lon protease-like protein